MSRDKQTEIQQFVIDLQNASQKASAIITDETAKYVKENHSYNNIVDYAKAHIKSRFEYEAEFLSELGYAKASEVAREIFEVIEEGIEAAVYALQFNNNPIHRNAKHEAYSSLMCFIKTIEEEYTEDKQ